MPDSLLDAAIRVAIDSARNPPDGTAPPHPSPADWRDQWIYFLMVDRFSNPAVPPKHAPFDDPTWDRFQGGTFLGIQRQLDYIKGLGAGAIWLSPVLANLPFDNYSYHGYGIHDFISAEPRFASDPTRANDELRDLVNAAHAKGLYVVLDIVVNHTGDVFAYSQLAGGSQAPFSPVPLPVYWRNDDGTHRQDTTPVEDIPNPSRRAVVWPKELQENAYFRRQGEPQPGGDDTIGDFDRLKQMRSDNLEFQNLIIRAYEYVIARFDVDGFRIDTLRYLRDDLPRLFGNAIREFAESIGKENFFTFGEVLDATAEADIARFIGRNTTDPRLPQFVGVDAALDYPLFNSLKPVVKGLSAPTTVIQMFDVRKSIESDIVSSHGDATRYFVTFLDNHDMKERLRYVDPGNEHRFDDQVTLGLTCLYGLPGIPCLYYGTEQGLHGVGSDAAVREALWGSPGGFDTGTSFYQAISAIAATRSEHAALRYGRHYFRQISGDGRWFGFSPYPGGVLAWSRILADTEVTVVANTSTTESVSVYVLVDYGLNPTGTAYRMLYSNKGAAAGEPSVVLDLPSVTVVASDGAQTTGSIRALHVVLQPMEAQILGR